jgi:hypothetical protein
MYIYIHIWLYLYINMYVNVYMYICIYILLIGIIMIIITIIIMILIIIIIVTMNNNYYYVYYYTCTLTTHVRKQEFRSMTHPSQLTTHGCQIRFWCWLPLIQHLGFKHGGKSLNQMERAIHVWVPDGQNHQPREREQKLAVGPLVTNAWTIQICHSGLSKNELS